MHIWRIPVSVVVACGLALGSCGSSSDDDSGSATTDLPTTEVRVETTAATTSETTTSSPETDSGEAAGCDQLLTNEEIESILGTAVEVSGSGKTCQLIFAENSVGSLQIFTGSQAEEAMSTLLPAFLNDPAASASGVALDDERGFVNGASAVVLGDSGRVFRFDAPANLESPDIQAAMLQIANLLLSR